MIDLLEPVHFVTQFPTVIHMINALPEAVIKVLQPGMASVIQFNHVTPHPAVRDSSLLITLCRKCPIRSPAY